MAISVLITHITRFRNPETIAVEGTPSRSYSPYRVFLAEAAYITLIPYAVFETAIAEIIFLAVSAFKGSSNSIKSCEDYLVLSSTSLLALPCYALMNPFRLDKMPELGLDMLKETGNLILANMIRIGENIRSIRN